MPPLPATVSPHSDEALLSLFIRNAACNWYDNATWIADLCRSSVPLVLTDRSYVARLAELFDVPEEEIARRCFSPVTEPASSGMEGTRRNFLGAAINEAFIDCTSVWLCPHCFREDGYLKAMWNLALYRVCHIHRCHLIRFCLCGYPISYLRKDLGNCECGRDIRRISPPLAQEQAIAFSEAINTLVSGGSIGDCLQRVSGEFKALSIDDVMTAVALLVVLVLPVSMRGGFSGAVRGIFDAEPSQISEAFANAVEMLEHWPRQFDAYVAERLDRVSVEFDIDERARNEFRSLLEWELPGTLKFLQDRVRAGVEARRERYFRSLLGSEFSDGDEHRHLTVTGAAAQLGLKADEMYSLAAPYFLLGRHVLGMPTRRIAVVDRHAIDAVLSGLEKQCQLRRLGDWCETIAFHEAKVLMYRFRIEPMSLVRALCNGAVAFGKQPGASTNLKSIRIGLHSLLAWSQRAMGQESDRWIPYAAAPAVLQLDHATFDYLCRVGHVAVRGGSGYPDKREVHLDSLLEFRKTHCVVARVADSLGVSRAKLANELKKNSNGLVAGPGIGGRRFVVRRDEMERLVGRGPLGLGQDTLVASAR